MKMPLFFFVLTYMIPKVKEYYHDGMAVVVTNPKYYALACLIEMVIMILIITNGVHLRLAKIILR